MERGGNSTEPKGDGAPDTFFEKMILDAPGKSISCDDDKRQHNLTAFTRQ
jgi:hypothetical protein